MSATNETVGSQIAILPSQPVFTLPEQVAVEEGLFEREGVTAASTDNWTWANDIGAHTWETYLARFRERGAHTYNMCEWGVINQIEHEVEEGARIGYLRPAVVAQGLVSFDPDVQEPHDLANRPVGIMERTGSHYTTLQLLDGVLRRDQIELRETMGVPEGLAQAREGQVAAASAMEPHLSLALKQGAHLVGLVFYRGGQIFGRNVTAEGRAAYARAINAAVDIINANREHYRSYLTRTLNGDLAPEELSLNYHRYTHVKEFTVERFEESYAWMQSRELATGTNTFEDIVAPVGC